MILPHHLENRKTPISNNLYIRSTAPTDSAESPVLRSPVTWLDWLEIILFDRFLLRLAQLACVVAAVWPGATVGLGIMEMLAAILAQLIILEYRR